MKLDDGLREAARPAFRAARSGYDSWATDTAWGSLCSHDSFAKSGINHCVTCLGMQAMPKTGTAPSTSPAAKKAQASGKPSAGRSSSAGKPGSSASGSRNFDDSELEMEQEMERWEDRQEAEMEAKASGERQHSWQEPLPSALSSDVKALAFCTPTIFLS